MRRKSHVRFCSRAEGVTPPLRQQLITSATRRWLRRGSVTGRVSDRHPKDRGGPNDFIVGVRGIRVLNSVRDCEIDAPAEHRTPAMFASLWEPEVAPPDEVLGSEWAYTTQEVKGTVNIT